MDELVASSDAAADANAAGAKRADAERGASYLRGSDLRAASCTRDEITSHGHAKEAAPHVVRPIQFGAITGSNIEMLRTLNLHIFPVRYNDTFYGDVLFVPKGYAQFAYWDGLVVGAICCRHEPVDALDSNSPTRTYIMTLGVLEPYRQYKIGSALLRGVIQLSQRDAIDHISLHVHTTNYAALCFYRKFGFEIHDTICDYYKRLEPPDCYVLVKRLTRKARECESNPRRGSV